MSTVSSSTLCLGEASAPEVKKWKVAYATFKKWKVEMDNECQTVMWLDCDTEAQAGKRFVTKIRCSTRTKFKTEIVSRRNFSERWIAGAESFRNNNIRDHAVSDQHIHAINLLKREESKASNAPTCSNAPIAQGLSKIYDHEREQLHQILILSTFWR